MPSNTPSPIRAVVDDPSVRLIYTNALIALSFDGNTLCVTLGDARAFPGQGPAANHVTARIAMTPGVAAALSAGINKMLQLASQQHEKALAVAQAVIIPASQKN